MNSKATAVMLIFGLSVIGCESSTKAPSSSNQESSVAGHLFVDQQKANGAMQNAGVATTSGAGNCNLATGAQDPSQIFQNLQAEIQNIVQDAENQNTQNLSTDVQNLQQTLIADCNTLLTDIQNCIPQSPVGGGPSGLGGGGSGILGGLGSLLGGFGGSGVTNP